MNQAVLKGATDIEVTVRRAARARRMSLRVSQLDGRVTLTLPTRVPEAEGLRFVEERADWIRKALSETPNQITVGVGAVVPVAGAQLTVAAGPGRGVRREGQTLYVKPDRAGAAVRAYLKTQARNRLADASDHYARLIGRSYKRLTLRDTRSRWGSCSSAGHLMYSWRLIMAPPEVLNYVAAHEVAHLEHMNHSAAFWGLVEEMCPDWKDHRTWLRNHGTGLHGFRFGD